MVMAGIDARRTQPEFVRRALGDEIARLTPAEKARFARLRIAAGDVARGVRLLQHENPRLWPAEERAANLLALARGQRRLGYTRAAEATLEKVPDDGTEASLEARVARADAALEKLRKRFPDGGPPEFSPLLAQREALSRLADPGVPVAVRTQALERLIRIACDRDQFEDGVALARRLVAESGEGGAGFESPGECVGRAICGDFDRGTPFERSSRSLPARRRGGGSLLARPLSGRWNGLPRRRLCAFARRSRSGGHLCAVRAAPHRRGAQVQTRIRRRPGNGDRGVRRVDELLRVHGFREAAAESRALPPSRGRDLRLAKADFAVGHFGSAVLHAARFPRDGHGGEGSVPESWRRLYYPIEEGGYIKERAEEFELDPAMLRALIRQESMFEAGAKSRAGALGLMQLMPATARVLSRSVLRQRYRKAFLYDPGINTRLGAAYLKNLLEHFQGRALFALAAYNGAPEPHGSRPRTTGSSRGRALRIPPFAETRDYVRRVLLYAESYRELYS
jgi:soluble lytic murein transglycosylase